MIKHDIYPFIPKHKNITNINSFFKKGDEWLGCIIIKFKGPNLCVFVTFPSVYMFSTSSDHFTILNSYAHSLHILTKSMSQHIMFQDYSLTIFNMP
jgi:hypothetical protein